MNINWKVLLKSVRHTHTHFHAPPYKYSVWGGRVKEMGPPPHLLPRVTDRGDGFGALEWKSWPCLSSSAAIAIQRAGPAPCLRNRVELAMMMWVQKAGLEGVWAWERAPLFAVCYTGWASIASAGELSQVMTMRENWQDDQTKYHPGSELKLNPITHFLLNCSNM